MIIARPGVGLFSHFLQVIGTTVVVQGRAVIPEFIVYFNRMFSYWTQNGYNGRRNAWEYYFEPLSRVSLSELIGVPEDKLQHFTGGDFSRYKTESLGLTDSYWSSVTGICGSIDEPRRKVLAKIVQDKIHVRDVVSEKVGRLKDSLFEGRKILGVHFRGTDKHPEIETVLKTKFVDFYQGEYTQRIDKYLDENPGAKVFLATDSSWTHDDYVKRYGDRLVSAPHKRSYNIALHGTNATPEQGEEAVIDALLLSRCDHLVHGISNLSLVSLLFNGNLSHEDVYDPKLGYLG